MARIDFDPAGIDTTDPFEVLPDGTEIIAEMIKSEMKATKAGTGHYLAAEFRQLEGGSRHFFANFNLDNPNAQAVNIARREMAALCAAAAPGKVISDSEELHGIPVVIVLGVEKAKGDFPAKNTIKNYKSVNPTQGESLLVTASKPAAVPAKSGAAPWAKPAA